MVLKDVFKVTNSEKKNTLAVPWWPIRQPCFWLLPSPRSGLWWGPSVGVEGGAAVEAVETMQPR